MKAATALSKRDDITSVRRELTIVKWMTGFVLALHVAIFVKLSMH